MNNLEKQEKQTQQYFSSNPQRELKQQNDGMGLMPKEQREFLRQFFGKKDDSNNAVGEDW
jgi:hypothetical protein